MESALPDNPVLTAKNARTNTRGIQITGRALAKIQAGMAEQGTSPADGAMRLSVQGGSCSGLTYNIRFDTNAHARDRIYEFDDVRLLVDPKSFIYLYGMILDYEQTFTVINPNSRKSCGCGSSFSA